MSSEYDTNRLLETFYDPEYTSKQVNRLAKLPDSLNQLGQILIGVRKGSSNLDYNHQRLIHRNALDELAILSPSDRQRLFVTLAPSISSEIEATWQLFDHLPYTSGYNRRPFRLPDSQSLCERYRARGEWVSNLMGVIKGYDQPITWFATWAVFFGWGTSCLGQLFAGAIDQGNSTGQEVYDILIASARGDHPIGKMGRHVVRGLLCASNPEGWAFIEHLLLAAQREEGLRQVILEAADESRPEAFLQLLRIVIDQNLFRFSAVVRAASVWLGLPFEAANPKVGMAALTKVQNFIEHPGTCQATLAEGTPEDQYLTLWSIAFRDVEKAVLAAKPLLTHPSAEHRFAAVYFLGQTQLAKSGMALLPMIDDADLRVAVWAYTGVTADRQLSRWHHESDLFERLERLIQRLPEKANILKPIVWDWLLTPVALNYYASALVDLIGTRSPSRLLPHLKNMHSSASLQTAKLFLEHINESVQYREALFDLAAGRDQYICEDIFTLLRKVTPNPHEIMQLEALLTRKTSSVRRGVIGLLMRQSDSELLASIDRLLGQKNEQQHLAGVDLLREMAQADRHREECQARVTRLQSKGLTEIEKHLLADLLAEKAVNYTLDDALGLANRDHLSQPIQPRSKASLWRKVKKISLGSSAAGACIEALDELIDQHRTEAIEIKDWQNETQTDLIGNIKRGLIHPDPGLSQEENRKHFQLAQVWEEWWQKRPKPQRDPDGFELVRAQAALSLLTEYRRGNSWARIVPENLKTFLDKPYDFHLKYEIFIAYILDWLTYLHPAPNTIDFLLDAVEETTSRIIDIVKAGKWTPGDGFWQISANRLGYIQLARQSRKFQKIDWSNDQQGRFWELLKWLEHSVRQKGGIYKLALEDVLCAFEVGVASEDDLFMFLLGQPQEQSVVSIDDIHGIRTIEPFPSWRFSDLQMLSGKRLHPLFLEFPFLKNVVDRSRDRIIEVEVKRGDLPTAASAAALALRCVPGADKVVCLLSAMGNSDFDRGYHSDKTRSGVLSHLIRVSYPLDTDSPENFKNLANQAHLSDQRLVEFAVFAPQWASFVEHTLGWHGMVDAVWWVYAHTKDQQWTVDTEIRKSWAAQIAEFTPLTAEELLDGAVDVEWFNHMVDELGEEHWQGIHRVALYAARGTGHARARLFADAMLGKLSSADLIERIQTKRHQDTVRALGLLPLPEDSSRKGEIYRRFEVMQEFIRSSKKFGSQRQASEKLAANIGIKNLARTAGYTDPQRFGWAMELEAVADLANGPICIQANGVEIRLTIDDLGEPNLLIRRGEKTLKDIPAEIKKIAEVSALVSRKHALDQQARRMRTSLETAMIRGDVFRATEIQALFGHPILRVMLEQLVFIGASGMGYPVDNGKALDELGKRIPLKEEERLRIVHPYDLLQGGRWHEWQHECFISERIQPCKQVFRELYLLTQTEQDEKNVSRRYAGNQVQPRQAIALFGNRGWMATFEEGIFRTFHTEGLVARVGFMQGAFTPAEVEGLTIETINFTRRGEWLPVKLDEVPPRIFSEVMRDLDLIVSVAHAGGVDPETSASTLEARAALIQETCDLLQLKNVRIENHHALVDGKFGNYTIHLGSGTVHKQPGGAVCIVPVHSQHRGRLFLPFVDNDPKTAEVLSKLLLLSKDQDIKDPSILEQILR